MLKELFDSEGGVLTKKASDLKTLLEFLEGSYLSMDGENLLSDIRLVSIKNLKSLLCTSSDNIDIIFAKEYLNHPSAWRVGWYDVRRHMMFAQQANNNTNPALLNLAKLNFNIIQATHQKDLKDVIRYGCLCC